MKLSRSGKGGENGRQAIEYTNLKGSASAEEMEPYRLAGRQCLRPGMQVLCLYHTAAVSSFSQIPTSKSTAERKVVIGRGCFFSACFWIRQTRADAIEQSIRSRPGVCC